jgi:hypothetical protein
VLIQTVLPLFAESSFDLIFREYAQGFPLMTLFDIIDDVFQILLVVVFAREKDEVPWCIFFVRVFAIDLPMRNERSILAGPSCLLV